MATSDGEDSDMSSTADLIIRNKAIFPVEDEDIELRNADKDVFLPENYRPTKCDVISGRGRKSYNHIANRRFRQLTAMNLKRYQNARCKVDKTLVVIGIVNSIRMCSPCGGFVKKCSKTDRWISMSDEEAREKVGHCLRDMIASSRESPRRREVMDRKHKEVFEQEGDFDPLMLSIKVPSSNTGDNNSVNNNITPSRGGVGGGGGGVPPIVVKRQQDEDDSILEMPIAGDENEEDLEKATQHMSEQQKQILHLLENGFQGSVEDLLRSTTS